MGIVEINIEKGFAGSVEMRIDRDKLEEVLTVLMKMQEVTFIGIK